MIVDLNVRGKHAVVVGGGTEGVRKVRGLLDQGCQITVISNRMNKFLREQERSGAIHAIKAKLTDASVLDRFDDLFLVLAATNDRHLNRALVEKGRSLGAFVYAADDPQVSDFSYASIINVQGMVQIAISTSGKSPIVARKLRIRAERMLRSMVKKSDIENARLQEFARTAAKSEIAELGDRKVFLYSLMKNPSIQNLIKAGRIEDAKSATLQLLKRWPQK